MESYAISFSIEVIADNSENALIQAIEKFKTLQTIECKIATDWEGRKYLDINNPFKQSIPVINNEITGIE